MSSTLATTPVEQIQNDNVLNVRKMSYNLEELTVILKEQVEVTKFSGFDAVRTDSEFLEKFIRLKDGNLKAALKAVKTYYAYIRRNINFINGIKPRDIADALNCEFVRILRDRFDGGVVAFFRFEYWNAKEISLRKLQHAMQYSMETYGLDPIVQEKGSGCIVDLGGVRFEHVWCATPREVYRTFSAVMNGLPIRITRVHLFNPPAIWWPVYKLIMSVLSQKMRSRVYIHQDLDCLHNYFEKEKLPVCLGGNLEDEDAYERHVIEELIEKIFHYDRMSSKVKVYGISEAYSEYTDFWRAKVKKTVESTEV